jgi:hypothetical protein
MLTIKIISEKGEQTIQEVKYVKAHPDPECSSSYKSVTYWETGNDPDRLLIMSGQVYVMNENGKTVADYKITPISDNVGVDRIGKKNR